MTVRIFGFVISGYARRLMRDHGFAYMGETPWGLYYNRAADDCGIGSVIVHLRWIHLSAYWNMAPWYQPARACVARTCEVIGLCTVIGSILAVITS